MQGVPACWLHLRYLRGGSFVIADIVKRAREQHRLTQGGVVDRLAALGVPMLKTTYSKIENGQRAVALDEVPALAKTLGIPPLQFLAPLDVRVPAATAAPTVAAVANMTALRARMGWTAQRVADELAAAGHAITRQAISKIENGDRGISLDLGFALANVLGVSIERLCSQPICDHCEGGPPRGYTCNACGRVAS